MGEGRDGGFVEVSGERLAIENPDYSHVSSTLIYSLKPSGWYEIRDDFDFQYLGQPRVLEVKIKISRIVNSIFSLKYTI